MSYFDANLNPVRCGRTHCTVFLPLGSSSTQKQTQTRKLELKRDTERARTVCAWHRQHPQHKQQRQQQQQAAIVRSTQTAREPRGSERGREKREIGGRAARARADREIERELEHTIHSAILSSAVFVFVCVLLLSSAAATTVLCCALFLCVAVLWDPVNSVSCTQQHCCCVYLFVWFAVCSFGVIFSKTNCFVLPK